MLDEKAPLLSAHAVMSSQHALKDAKDSESKRGKYTISDGNRRPELDGLRGLCACFVVLYHLYLCFYSGVHWRPLLGCGPVAVFIFFILSGHVIAHRYLEDGRVESLLSAAFRRIPRLLLPMFIANVLYWVLLICGAFSSEGTWRRIYAEYVHGEDRSCASPSHCIPADLHYTVLKSLQVLWTREVNNFQWIWTIAVEIIGSAAVFLLAPLSLYIVNSGSRAGNTPELPRGVEEGRWPRELTRCLLAHGTLLSMMFIAGQLISHCADVSGVLAPMPWCGGLLVSGSLSGLNWLGIDHWRELFLFELGLASAQTRVLMIGFLDRESPWAEALVARWNEQWLCKWFVPTSMIIFGLGTTTVPYHNVIELAPLLSIKKTGFDMWSLGAVAIFLGVLLSPCRFRHWLANFSFLGNISFGIYLLHMGVIWTVGMSSYSWLHGRVPDVVLFPLVTSICAGPLFLVSWVFWRTVEEPLSVSLPRQTFSGLKLLILRAKSHQHV